MNSEYPLYDGIGSGRTVTAANQSVFGTITFEGFGQTIATTGSSTNPYMFKGAWGYRNDGDAGLSHVGARYYDAQVGRFITRDTYLDQHPYLYCDHDPTNHADPTGHDRRLTWTLIGAVVGTFVGGPGSGSVIGGMVGYEFGELLTLIGPKNRERLGIAMVGSGAAIGGAGNSVAPGLAPAVGGALLLGGVLVMVID